MSETFRPIDNEIKDLHTFLSQSLFSSKFKNYFYGFFCQLFKVKYNRKTKPSAQLSYEILINVVFTLQITSLAWYPNMNVSGWSSYIFLWKLFGWASYDSICANLGVMDFCFYGTVSLLAMCLVSFTVFGFFIYIKKDPPIYISIWPRKIAMLLTTVCLVPSAMILLMIGKYSIISANMIEEYDGLSSSILDFGFQGIFLSLIGLAVLISINLYCEYFSCDIQHSHPEKNLKSRSCSLIDMQKRLFYILACISFSTFVNSEAIYHQSILFSFSLFLSYKSITILQYFNELENIIEACKLSVISFTMLFFIFGELLDSASIVIVFTIFLQPIIFLLIMRLARRNYTKLKDSKECPKNQFEFERKFRHLLTDKDHEDKFWILDLFKTFWKANKFQKDKLFVIWEFNYCLSIVKDERLARVKLSKIGNAKTSFEGEIQEWRLFTWLVKKKCKAFPETSYLEFLKEFSRIRTQDEELCYLLIELQAEISLKSPRIDKIINLSKRTTNYLINISEDLKNLCDKYKNVEGYELYGSFLENISSNHEEAEKMIRKKNGLEYYNKQNNTRKIENYGKDVPILLVSCNDNNIMYLNEKASRLFKTSIGNVLGTSLLNFIPQPFDVCHMTNIKDFVLDSSTIELPSHKNLFFKNIQGYLFECNFLFKLTAFHNCAYFLISFEQRKATREIALISDDGFIMGHSELFPFYIGSKSKFLKGQTLSSLVPILDTDKMRDYEPWLMPFNGGEIAFINTKKEINSTTIHNFIILHDDQEIKNWKEGTDHDQFTHFADQDMTLDFDKSQIEEGRKDIQVQFLSVSNISLLPRPSFETEVYTNEELQIKDISTRRQNEPSPRNEDKKSGTEDFSKSSVGSKFSKQAQNLLSESKRKIRILQIVLFIVMSSFIVVVGAILGYMITDISYTTSLSSFKNLGQLLYDLGLSADSVRVIDNLKMINMTDEQLNNAVTDFQILISDLESIQGTIFKDFDQWSYCSVSKIVKNPLIPLIYFDTFDPIVKYSNLYDAISELILNCKGMVSAVSDNDSYLKYIRFVLVNGSGYLFERVNSTMNGIVDCETERVKMTGIYINALLIFGFLALGVLVLVIIGYIIFVSRKQDEFWNFILNNAQWALVKLKSSAVDRLILVHGIDYSKDLNMEISGNRIKRKVKTSVYVQYSWRLMVFFIIAASYYLLISLYLYPKCENFMINRPKLLSNFNIRRSTLRKLSMLSRETYSHYFQKKVPQYFQYANGWTSVNMASIILRFKNKELRESDLKKLMSKELRERIYNKVDSDKSILDYGTEAAINAIIGDCENQGYYEFIPPSKILAVLDEVVAIQNEISQEFLLADRDSKNLINNELDSIINVTVAYSISLIILYTFYYLPYFNGQIKQLNRFLILPEILPMDSNNMLW
ncbi:unnamed protein product [Blepharisma stoltei]|uniref:PAS domain-containing protein n=1 Tax=Blepharisma stoltei TaxID=1481888 RepID=A0AAU9IY60_9CILI|nr:unnamed protein product [Blepharisma stoltei]